MRRKAILRIQRTPDLKLNGKLTLGENVADNGGLRIAYMALMDTLAGKKPGKIDGFTPEQRLFLGWGQIWCQNQTEKIAPDVCADGSALSRPLASQWRRIEHARVPKGLWLQSWNADGSWRSSVPRMVAKRFIGAAFLAAISANAQSTGFNAAHIDKSVEPCSNFFQYACGNWIKNNPIPSDRSRWSRFEELAARNENILLDILQTSAAKKNGSPIEQKIGAYYTACMDEKGIEAKGLASIKPELDRIAALKDKSGLADLLERQHAFGAAPLFNFYARVDYKNSQLMIGWLDQGGLGLPDRDYYFRNDAKSAEIRAKYVDHMTRMFSLAGYEASKAASSAKAIMSIETALAKASQDRVARRNANNLDHPDTVDGIKTLAPAFDWKRYFDKSGTPSLRNINIANPEFFQESQPGSDGYVSR